MNLNSFKKYCNIHMFNTIYDYFYKKKDYNTLHNTLNNEYYLLSLIKHYSNDSEIKYNIHGLWPQYEPVKSGKAGEKNPEFCKEVDFSLKALDLIIDELNQNWYSDTKIDNATFWEHEYKKHGSCMFKEMTELEYFSKTLELFEEAIKRGLPDKHKSNNLSRVLIPVNLDFTFI